LFDEEHMHSSAAHACVTAALQSLSQDFCRLTALSDAADRLQELVKKVCVVDIQYLLFLVGQTNEAARKIQGEDIILPLGSTGVGKSTTIHFLAGSRMVEEDDDILPVDVRDAKLARVHVGGGGNSVMRVITPIRITFEYENELISVFVCDTPGFKDTAGVEVDVANSIGLINAVRGARSVRPVVIISTQDGPRLEGVSDLATTLACIVEDRQQHIVHPRDWSQAA
jgi:hypothetical protein